MNKLTINSYIKDAIFSIPRKTVFKNMFLDKEKRKVKNVTEVPDYKTSIGEDFPFLSNHDYELICKRLDEVYDEAVRNEFLGYYVSYGNYVYNKLRTLSQFINSQGDKQICDVIYNYKVLCHADDFINLTYEDYGISQLPYLSDYTKESSDIQKDNSAKATKFANILNGVSIALIFLICILSFFAKSNVTVSIVGITLSAIFLFIGDKILCAEQTKGQYDQPKKEKEISNDLSIIASHHKKCRILSDEEFVDIIFSTDSISYYLLDCTLYLVSHKLENDSYEEFRELVLGSTFDKQILKTVKDLKNKYDSEMEYLKQRMYSVPKLQAITADSSYVKKSSSKACSKIKVNLTIAAVINILTVCAILLF